MSFLTSPQYAYQPLVLIDTTNAVSTSTGTLIVSGGIGVSGYSVMNLTTIASLVVNSRNINPSLGDIIEEKSFIPLGNNNSGGVTGFSFDNSLTRSFTAQMSLIYNGTVGGTKYSQMEIRGIQASTGSWKINETFIGDIISELGFFMHSSGQLMYTSAADPSFVSALIKFRATTTSVGV